MSRLLVMLSVLVLAGWKPTWRWEHPSPHGATIEAMYGSGATVYAVGSRGTLMKSRDSGATWAPLASDVVEDLHAIAGDGSLTVAVGDGGRLLVSRDGTAFDKRAMPSPMVLVDVAVRASTVVAVASDGVVLRSTNGAGSFATLPGVKRLATSIAIAPTGIFVGTHEGLFRSTDNGATFASVTAEPVQRIVVDDRGTIYALAGSMVRYPALDACGSCIDEGYETAALYRSTDGATWQRRALEDPTTTTRAWGAPKAPAPPAQPPRRLGHRGVGAPHAGPAWGKRALVLGSNGELYAMAGTLYVSTDRSATFATAKPHAGVLWATPTWLVSAGEHGAIARSRDRGASWQEVVARAVEGELNLFAIAATPGDRAFAVGMDGMLLARDGQGRWAKVAVPTGKYQRLEAVHAIDDRTVIAVGERGVILQSTDGGKRFVHRASDRTTDLTAVWGIGDEVFAAGRETLLYSKDRGATWRSIPSKLYSAHRFWGTSMDDVFLAGEGLFHSRDRGVTWREVHPALGGLYQGIWGSRSDDLFIVGYDGKILHSRDRGTTWTPRPSGTTRHLHAIWGRGDQLFVVGDNVVLHSSDHGATWREEPVPTDADTAVFAVTGTADAVYLLGSRASILRRPLR